MQSARYQPTEVLSARARMKPHMDFVPNKRWNMDIHHSMVWNEQVNTENRWIDRHWDSAEVHRQRFASAAPPPMRAPPRHMNLYDASNPISQNSAPDPYFRALTSHAPSRGYPSQRHSQQQSQHALRHGPHSQGSIPRPQQWSSPNPAHPQPYPQPHPPPGVPAHSGQPPATSARHSTQPPIHPQYHQPPRALHPQYAPLSARPARRLRPLRPVPPVQKAIAGSHAAGVYYGCNNLSGTPGRKQSAISRWMEDLIASKSPI